ncbi:MAG: SGNH/GDSL hydrolase family protein, partial [Actinomycetota bacterium]
LWQTCRRHPVICGGIGFLLLVAGGLIFLFATSQRAVWTSVLFAIAGALVGSLGLLFLNELIRHYVTGPGNRTLGQIAGMLLLVIAAGAIWFAIQSESPLIAIVGSVILILGLLFLFAALSDVGQANPTMFTIAGLALMALAVLLLVLTDGATVVAAVAIGVGVLGLVVFKIGLGPFIDRSDDPKRERIDVTVAAAAATAVGAVLLYLAPRTFDEPLLLGGFALLIVGLTALGIGLVRFTPRRLPAALIVLVGGAAVLYGWFQIDGILDPFDLALFATLVLAGIGAWFVFRGEALVAVLLLGFVLGWVLVDRIADDPLSPTSGGEGTIVALGDSYISGEGAPRFFPGTNLLGSDGNQCRRAPTAYPYLVADRLHADLIFLACSGAATDDLDGDGLPQPLPDPPRDEDQLARLLAEHGDNLDDIAAVLVSIGGNDVGFGTIIQACLLPQNCADPANGRTGRWLDNVERVGPELERTYRGMRTALGDDVPIVVMLYPLIVAPSPDCSLTINDDEIEFVGQFTAALNERITEAAAAAGVNVIDSADAFAGRLLCDEDPATNFIQLSPQNGPIGQRILPTTWVHGSMHPRADGHELLADLLVTDPHGDGGTSGEGELAALLEAVEAGGPANPPGTGTGTSGGPAPAYQELPDPEWIQQRLFETVRDLLAPVAALVLGGLIVAWGIVSLRIPVLSFLSPMEPASAQAGPDRVGSGRTGPGQASPDEASTDGDAPGSVPLDAGGPGGADRDGGAVGDLET